MITFNRCENQTHSYGAAPAKKEISLLSSREKKRQQTLYALPEPLSFRQRQPRRGVLTSRIRKTCRFEERRSSMECSLVCAMLGGFLD